MVLLVLAFRIIIPTILLFKQGDLHVQQAHVHVHGTQLTKDVLYKGEEFSTVYIDQAHAHIQVGY